jgi:hypothetical protein
MIIIRKDFVPRQIAALVDFLINFKTKFAIIGLTVGFSQPEIDVVTAEITDCEKDLNDKITKQAEVKAAVTKFNGSKKKVVETIRTYAARTKTSPDYTPEMGDELRIVGEEITIDPETSKPELSVSLQGGLPEIKWKKHYADGVNIYCKRADEADFEFLARDTASPYVDNRENKEPGKPEDREYIAYYVYEDLQKGIESDTVKITVK